MCIVGFIWIFQIIEKISDMIFNLINYLPNRSRLTPAEMEVNVHEVLHLNGLKVSKMVHFPCDTQEALTKESRIVLEFIKNQNPYTLEVAHNQKDQAYFDKVSNKEFFNSSDFTNDEKEQIFQEVRSCLNQTKVHSDYCSTVKALVATPTGLARETWSNGPF